MDDMVPNAEGQKRTALEQFGCESDLTIKCPKCGAVIRVSESVADMLTQPVRQEYERRMDETVASAAKSADERVAAQVEQKCLAITVQEATRIRKVLEPDLDEQKRKVALLQETLKQTDARLVETQKGEAEALKKKRELESEKRDFDLAVQRGIDAAVTSEREAARREAAEAADRKAGEVQDIIRDLQKKLAEAHDAEAEVMRAKRELA